MPDRLVELYQRLADKVEEIDALVKEAARADPRARGRFSAQWDELAALVGRQKPVLGEIVKQAEEVSSLSAFLQTHYEREKAGLARKLHDQLGGILTPAKMDLSWLQAHPGSDPEYAQRLARLAALIDQGIDLKRRITEDLRPSLIDHLGFAAAVQWYVDEACGAAHIGHRVTIGKLERLPSDLEIALYRVVQESLQNIARHSGAKRVSVSISVKKNALAVSITDDGSGFELEEARGRGGLGLIGMEERTRLANGKLSITARKGHGTRISVAVPLQAGVT